MGIGTLLSVPCYATIQVGYYNNILLLKCRCTIAYYYIDYSLILVHNPGRRSTPGEPLLAMNSKAHRSIIASRLSVSIAY